MWPLLAIAGAIVCWTFGDDWRQELTPLTQQLKTAAALAGRGAPLEITALRAKAAESKTKQRSIERGLKAEGDIELVRAYLNSDLRRFCLDALAKNCVVRVADDSLLKSVPVASASQAPLPGAPAAVNGLESLGVLRARATVSGVFVGDEPVNLLKLLAQDSQRTWRTNAVVVRNDTFEIDVERLVLVATAAGTAR